MRLVVLATFAALAPLWAQQRAAKPASIKTEARLDAIRVDGNRQIPAQRILAIADLRLGSIVSKKDFDAARERLAATGAFETVGYVYKPTADGQDYDLTLEVHEIDITYPYRFERLPVPDEALRQALRAQEPLWGDQIPVSSIERYVDVIAHAGVNVPVTWKVEDSPGGGPAIVFEPASTLPNIAEVRFQGNDVLPKEDLLRAINEVAIGIPYTEQALRLRLDAAVRPLYDARGRIRVSFPKITVEKAEKVEGVVATVTVDEGSVYKLGEIRFTGLRDSEAAQLSRSAGLAKGDIANFNDVKAAEDRAEKKYRSNGYLRVKSEVVRDIHDDTRTVNVTIAMNVGPKYRFGKLIIQGLDLLSEPEIRKAWGAMEGRPYQPDYADLFLDRLRAEKVFDNLGKTSAAPRIDETSKTVDITLTFGGAKDAEKPASPYAIPSR